MRKNEYMRKNDIMRRVLNKLENVKSILLTLYLPRYNSNEPYMSVKKLNSITGIPKSTLKGVLKNLVKIGWIEKRSFSSSKEFSGTETGLLTKIKVKNSRRKEDVFWAPSKIADEFFKSCVAVSNRRYQHYEIAVRLLFLEHSIQTGKIVSTKKKLLDKFVRDHKEKLPVDGTIEMVKSVLQTMTNIFSSKDQLLKKHAKIPIYYLLTREAKRQNLVKNITIDKIKSFNMKVEENKKIAEQKGISAPSLDIDLWKYERSTIQGTNDPGSIKERFRIIAKEFKIDYSDIYGIDSKKKS